MVTKLGVAILAAGQGTRMQSDLNKVLHPVCGMPMVLWSVAQAEALGADPIVLVVGNGADAVREAVGERAQYAVQRQRLGTAHALLQGRDLLRNRAETVLVLYGDMPTLRPETVARLVAQHTESAPAVTLLTVRSHDSMGFGRVVRDERGRVEAIVEEAAATPEILALTELNCGVYCCDGAWLWERLPQVAPTPPKNEYYFTDVIALAVADGRGVESLCIEDVDEVMGINTRVQLAQAEAVLRRRINEQWMLAGVTLVDPAATYIDATVRIGRDTVVYPNTMLQGDTEIGRGAAIGPNSIIRDSRIGEMCRVLASVVEEAIMEEGAEIGPFGHLRPKAHLGAGVHMGNFGEVKDAYLAPGTKMGHFSYVGNARVGEDVNIGAGTITCNYDGHAKHTTVIGPGAFIGSGSMLVAPLTIGAGAKIGAGAVVTRDVPAGTVAYGVPARPKKEVEEEDAT
jgi:bifunctional UDP-N-acetylglucosamine pyrophosphorylase / glucosamine-1-phosphate N-acetyltransferase